MGRAWRVATEGIAFSFRECNITIKLYKESIILMDPVHLDAVLAALGDPTRRALLTRLAQGEATVAELARPFAISQPAVSRHLRVLEDAGLIESRIDGSARPRRLRADAITPLWDWLTELRHRAEANAGRLDAVLAELQTPPAPPDNERPEPCPDP
jgi:DNA-binding transcriptional ArsR family regulator